MNGFGRMNVATVQKSPVSCLLTEHLRPILIRILLWHWWRKLKDSNLQRTGVSLNFCWDLLSWVSDLSVSIIMANQNLESEGRISLHTWPPCQEIMLLLLLQHLEKAFLVTSLSNTMQGNSSLWGDPKVFTLSVYSLIFCFNCHYPNI